MASAVQSLIAISDAMDLPRKKPRRFLSGNFFGPWIPDENWIPRKHTSSGQHKKRHSKGRDAIFKRLSQPKSYKLLERSSYEQDKELHDQKFVTEFQDKFGFEGEGEDISLPSVNKRPSTVSGDFDENESFGEKAENRVSHPFNRTALPALITLTTDTGDERAIFGLGKQLELKTNKQNKLYVAKRKSPSRNVASAPSGENSHLPPIHSLTSPGSRVIDKENLNGPNGKSDALRRAFAKRNPIPPRHNYEDISQHMKFYRINHTVMGTGRFSLANNDDIEREIKPVQWVDVFPNRPLNDTTPVTDVPVFRFSSADFRLHSSLPIPTPEVPPARPSTPTLATSNNDLGLRATGNLNLPGEFGTSLKDKRLHFLEKVLETDGEDNDEMKSPRTEWKKYETGATKSYTVYNDSIRPAKEKEFDQNRGLHAYKEYLKVKDKVRRMSHLKDSDETDDKVSTGSNNNKHERREKDRKTDTKNLKRTPKLSPVRERKDEAESDEDSNPDLIINETHAKNAKKKFRYPGSLHKRRVLANMSIFGKHNPKSTKLVVDAHRLTKSVDDKIVEGEENLRRSFEDVRKMRRNVHHLPTVRQSVMREPSIPDFTEDNADVAQEISQDRCTSQNKAATEGMVSESSASVEPSRVAECSSSLGLVTAYDFKGYIQAMRSDGKDTIDDELTKQQEKIITEISKNRPGTVSETSKILLGKNKKWNPKESRVKTALRRKSREMTNPEEFQRSSSSATLKFKPTSPATSAFVIAAPPPSVGIDKRTVVLPLNDFMQMAMDSREQSFSDWTNSLNSSAKIGVGFGGRAGTSRKSRDEGLLRVVSFATPVNQFIFAKKITAQSASNFESSPFLEDQETSGVDKYLSRMNPNKFRLKLSDFGLEDPPRKRKHREKDDKADDAGNCFDEAKDKNVTDVNDAGQLNQADNKCIDVPQATETVLNTDEDNENVKGDNDKNVKGDNDKNVKGDNDKNVKGDNDKNSPCETVQQRAVNSKGRIRLQPHAELNSLKRSSTTISQEAHACLRREVLRLIEEKRAKSASGSNFQKSTEKRSIWSTHNIGAPKPSSKDVGAKSSNSRNLKQFSSSALALRKVKDLNPTPDTPPSTPQLRDTSVVGQDFIYESKFSYDSITNNDVSNSNEKPECQTEAGNDVQHKERENYDFTEIGGSADVMVYSETPTRSKLNKAKDRAESRQCFISRRSSSRSSDDPLVRPKTVRFSSEVSFADDD